MNILWGKIWKSWLVFISGVLLYVPTEIKDRNQDRSYITQVANSYNGYNKKWLVWCSSKVFAGGKFHSFTVFLQDSWRFIPAKVFKISHLRSVILRKLLKASQLENFFPVNFPNKLENGENIPKFSGNNNGGVSVI